MVLVFHKGPKGRTSLLLTDQHTWNMCVPALLVEHSVSAPYHCRLNASLACGFAGHHLDVLAMIIYWFFTPSSCSRRSNYNLCWYQERNISYCQWVVLWIINIWSYLKGVGHISLRTLKCTALKWTAVDHNQQSTAAFCGNDHVNWLNDGEQTKFPIQMSCHLLYLVTFHVWASWKYSAGQFGRGRMPNLLHESMHLTREYV